MPPRVTLYILRTTVIFTVTVLFLEAMPGSCRIVHRDYEEFLRASASLIALSVIGVAWVVVAVVEFNFSVVPIRYICTH